MTARCLLLLAASVALARGELFSARTTTVTKLSRWPPSTAPPNRHVPERSLNAIRESITARKIVHKSNWTSVSYISHAPETKGLPLVALFSVSDGAGENGTGIPYFYVSRLQDAVTDLVDKDNHCALMMSLAQTDECKNKSLDAEDPRCAHIVISGTFHSIDANSSEHKVAKKAVFSRHPGLIHLPQSHHFFFAKLNISKIILQDRFGGPVRVPVQDYFNAYKRSYWNNRHNAPDPMKILSEDKLTKSSQSSTIATASFSLSFASFVFLRRCL